MFLKNSLEFVELVHSMGRIGVTVVPLNFRYSAAELARAVNFSDARILIADAELLSVVDEARQAFNSIRIENIYVVGDASHAYESYEALLAIGDDQPIVGKATEDDVLWMPFTGGTTGDPKACLVSHRNAALEWLTIGVEVGVGPDDVQLVAGPLFHGLGFEHALAAIFVGATIVVMRDFRPEQALRIIEAEKVTYAPMAPTLFAMLLSVENRADFDVSSVRRLLSAGAPLLTAQKLGILEYFWKAGLIELYGSTEGGIYTMLKPPDQLRKVRCAGQPVLGVEIKIVDLDGNECEQGEVGTIYKRGPMLGPAYYKNPEATAAQFMDGWHTSEDMGKLDSEGYLYIFERKKDMIISGGVNIYPTEIEEVLTSHLSVREAAVIGIPDEKWGESLLAFIVAEPGSVVDTAELIALCGKELARYKAPRKFEFVTELPKTGVGKLARKALREPYWAGQEAKV
jgi:acyl-CoA synthetase (AMP-forming)/AMP-acid ligase II